VLARLEQVEGVADARVDATGAFLAIAAVPGAAPDALADRIVAALRGRARRLDDRAAAAQLAARERGDPWYAFRDTLGLCYLEARILASRAGGAVADAAGLGGAEAAAVTEAARVELFALMEQVHGEGGRPSSGWFYEAWPAVATRIAARCRSFLEPAAADAAAAALADLHG
jgi:hypothetical protein